jgi:hypothetical protein
MNAQSGAFLLPGSVSTSLEEQIGTTYGANFADKSTYRSLSQNNFDLLLAHRVWKLIVPRRVQSDLFRFLSRCNVRGYSLFPGLEGLAASLREMMRGYE